MSDTVEHEQLREALRKELQNPEARYAYAEAFLNAFVATQLKTLREERRWSQQKLAEMIGTKQSGISRLENIHYSAWKIETLKRLAKAFDLRLHVSFEGFGDLWKDVATFNQNSLKRQAFSRDPEFSNSVAGAMVESEQDDIAESKVVPFPELINVRPGGLEEQQRETHKSIAKLGTLSMEAAG